MSPTIDGMPRELANTIVDALSAGGTDTMFGVPGGGANLEIVGAATDAGMRFVLAHGETASCIMAGTYGLLRDQPGATTMTRGPGAASAVNGALQATLDRSPLVLLSDTVAADHATRVPHQRVDQLAMFSPATKFSGTIGSGDARSLARAAVALTMKPPAGAVHLDFDPSAPSDPPPRSSGPPEIDPRSLERALELAEDARRPIVLAGVEAWPWVDDVRAFVEETGCPAMTTYQARGMVSDRSPHAAGVFTNGAIERPLIESADLILAVGLDPVELIPTPWAYESPVVSILPWAMGDPYYEPETQVVGPIGPTLKQMRTALGERDWGESEAADFRRRSLDALESPGAADVFDPADVVAELDQRKSEDTIITVDAGAHMLVAVPQLTITQPRGLLISNGIATMGYAVPAAIGAALAHPDRPVVALTGDGGLGMVLAELETVARLDLDVTVIVFNDAALSLIEIKQGPGHGGSRAVRYNETDFSAVARGMGLPATTVRTRRDLGRALEEGSGGPRLLDARVDPASYRHVIDVTRG